MNTKTSEEMTEEEYNTMVDEIRSFVKQRLPIEVHSFVIVYQTPVGYGDIGVQITSHTVFAMREIANLFEQYLEEQNIERN